MDILIFFATALFGAMADLWGSVSPDVFLILGFALFGLVLPGGFPGKAMFDTTQPGGEHAEDVSPQVSILSPKKTPLLAALGIAPQPINNIRHEWLEDELIPDSSILQNALAANAAAVTLNVPDADIFQTNELILVGSNFPNVERMLVAAINTNTNQITVTRGYGQGVPIAHASGTDIWLGGEVSIEGDDAPASQKTTMERPFNISHIFNYKVEMTGTRLASVGSHLGDIGNEWAYTKQKRLIEAMRDLESAIVFSDWNFVGGNPSLGGAAIRRTMRGILSFFQFGVRYNTGGTATVPANCYRNAGAVQFTFDNFRALQQSVVYANGAQAGEASLLLIPPALKESVGKWKRGAQGMQTVTTAQDAQNVTEIVNVVDTDYGRVYVVMVPRLGRIGNLSLLLCPNLIKVKNYVSRSFFYKPLGDTGDREAEELIGEYGLEMVGITQGWHSLCYNWAAIP